MTGKLKASPLRTKGISFSRPGGEASRLPLKGTKEGAVQEMNRTIEIARKKAVRFCCLLLSLTPPPSAAGRTEA